MSIEVMEDLAFLKLRTKLSENCKEFVVFLGPDIADLLMTTSWQSVKETILDNAIEYCNSDAGERGKAVIFEDLKDKQANCWDVFSAAKKHLPAKYVDWIQRAFSSQGNIESELLEILWRLDVSGIIYFAMDKIPRHALAKTRAIASDFATGFEAYKFLNFLNKSEKFVLNVFGDLADTQHWALTRTEQYALFNNQDFKSFFQDIFKTKEVIMLGFDQNVIDINHFLAKIGVDVLKSNVYIFACNDGNFDKRYAFVNMIKYEESQKKEILVEAFKNLLEFVSVDQDVATVYHGKLYTRDDIPSRATMGTMGYDDLREILNGVVAGIIPPDSVPNEAQISELQEFYATYSPQLHEAWFIDYRNDMSNKLMGYRIVGEVGRGAFGQVFEAFDDGGNRFAIKVLLSEVREKISYLNCFRRGTRAMRILKRHNIDGMVGIHSAFEIPASIVMDYVEGPTLREAVTKKYVSDIHIKLRILIKVAEIIRAAHSLDEVILHRDLKPENIILDHYFSRSDDTNIPVKIIDFDLAWHREATEKTVIFGVSQGFMAPEQANSTDMSRKTSVDVYSIGMLIFFFITEKNPAANQHEFASFYEDTLKLISDMRLCEWKVFPTFITQIITEATYQDPAQRVPLDTIIRKLNIALDMCLSNQVSNVNSLFLIEIAIRAGGIEQYTTENNGRTVIIKSPSTGKDMRLEITRDRHDTVLYIYMKKERSVYDNREIKKYYEEAAKRSIATADNSLFYTKRKEPIHSGFTISLYAKLPDKISLDYIDEIANNLIDIKSKMDLQ